MTLWTPTASPGGHCSRPCCGKWSAEIAGHTVSQTLNEIADFDNVIRVLPDGTIEDDVTADCPWDVYCEVDDEGQCLPDADVHLMAHLARQGWDVLTGYSGQYSYSGPVMHPSEYLGGDMAADMIERPGLYVVCAVYPLGGPEDDQEPFGWIIAFRAAA